MPIASAAEEAALNAAYERGIVLVAASGNASEPVVSYPAGYASVIAVGATDENDQLATFSSWGQDQELTAPGVLNYSSVPVGTGQLSSVTVETDNARELEAVGMQFAGMTKKNGLTGATVYAGLGTAAEFSGIDCRDRTALITRGGLTFADKTRNAMTAGCVGAVIHNNQPGNFNGTLGTAGNWVPVVSISLDDGLYLKNQIDSRPTTTTLLNVAGNHALFSGTSMASPHAAGVAALIRGKNPAASPADVRAVLQKSADDRGTPGRDPLFGFGRVNAKRAVQ